MAEKYIENHVARRLFPVTPDPECANKGDIVTYERVQKVKKVGDGPDDYVVYEDVVETERVNRHDFIMQDASDVGVLNVLEKVRRSGDVTLLNQTGASIPVGLQDYTKVPGSIGEALKSVESGANSFAALKTIFGDISFEDLANMSNEQLETIVQSYIDSRKKGEQVNE